MMRRLQVKCSNCREETPQGSWIYVDPQEQAEMNGSRGTANLAMKVSPPSRVVLA
jgi:hypothetical protein